METLGKCLLFYLKYPAEMSRLFEAEEPNSDGLPNADEILKKTRLVGDAANWEAAQFLERCAPAIEGHFRAFGPVRRKRSNLEKTWSLQFHVGSRESKTRRFWIGVEIDLDLTALVPWVWSPGGYRAADEVRRILNRGSRPTNPAWRSGTTCLDQIPILIPERIDAPVPCEGLVTQVQHVFKTITAEDVKAILEVSKS
jgi:hypothetical protein